METERELTVDLMNIALKDVSQEKGYCLCIHPMMTVINFVGTSCKWCDQPVTNDSYGPDAKNIRTNAVIAAYPWAVKN
jgi:hypothetical protein